MKFPSNMSASDLLFLLQHCFHEYVSPNSGENIFWRECLAKDNIYPDSVGYIWVWEDGQILHSYKTPEQCNI